MEQSPTMYNKVYLQSKIDESAYLGLSTHMTMLDTVQRVQECVPINSTSPQVATA